MLEPDVHQASPNCPCNAGIDLHESPNYATAAAMSQSWDVEPCDRSMAGKSITDAELLIDFVQSFIGDGA